MADFEAHITRQPAHKSYKYQITYFKDGNEINDIGGRYELASFEWGAKSLARRMLKKLRKVDAQQGKVIVIT